MEEQSQILESLDENSWNWKKITLIECSMCESQASDADVHTRSDPTQICETISGCVATSFSRSSSEAEMIGWESLYSMLVVCKT